MGVKKTFLFTFVLATILISMSFVLCADVLTFLPASSTSVIGTASLNVTNTTVDGYMLNCIFNASSSSTDNSSASLNVSALMVNSSVLNQTIKQDWVTTGWEDSSDYTITATCQIGNGTNYTLTNTGIEIDNTVPDTPTLSPSTNNKTTTSDITLTATVVDRNTTGCTLRFTGTNPGSSSYTMTYSGSTCSYALTNVPEATYTWYVTASDGTDTTDATANRFEIDVQTSAGKKAVINANQQIIEQQNNPANTNTPIIIIAVIIVFIIIMVLLRKK